MKYEGTWVKGYRGKTTEELMAANPRAYLLLNQIAIRAQRTYTFNRYDLDVGEALLGDYDSLKMTRGEYRYAKQYLQKKGFATFRTTNRGTVAKLINFDVFDPNLEGDDQQNDRPATVKQPAVNHPTTTTNNVKKENKAKNGKRAPSSSNGEMSKDVKAISLDKIIREKKKEAEVFKDQNRGEAAGGEYIWTRGSKEGYLEMRSEIKELESERESILGAKKHKSKEEIQ